MKGLISTTFVVLLIGASVGEAQSVENFTEAELLHALSWGMPASEAERLAKVLSNDSTLDIGPEGRASGPLEIQYSEDLLLLLSLVSEEARQKAERHLAQQRVESALSHQERLVWDARRKALRARLLSEGKSPGAL